MNKNRFVKLPILLLTLFVAYQMGVIMFTHVHYLNGVMVVHSHPSKDSHTHTEGQIVTIAQVASFISTEPTQTALNDVLLPVLRSVDFNDLSELILTGYNQFHYLRAPPVSYSIL